MTQAALTDTAAGYFVDSYIKGAPLTVAPAGEDPLLLVIKQFGIQVDQFEEDLTGTMTGFAREPLGDEVEMSQFGEVATLISMLSSQRSNLLKKIRFLFADYLVMQERNMMCGACYAGRTGTCSTRYTKNAQSDKCLEACQRKGETDD
jgi:hypothetical protein